MICFKKIRGLAFSLALLSCAQASSEEARTPDLSGRNDASIREVLKVVSRHQIRPLKDGDYSPADSLTALAAARQPEGIAWEYPWGVTLYGALRSTDAT